MRGDHTYALSPERVAFTKPARCVRQVEREADGARWCGDFSRKYVEEVSAKTGSFKKFAVFAKMLVAAVVDASESVFVDLLTYADLERLKRERSSGRGEANVLRSASATQRDASPASQKRYLILTHADEFDRTHYPLPLLFEDDPSPQALRAMVERLRRENQRLRAAGSEEGGAGDGDDARARCEENTELRKKVEYLESRLVAGGDALDPRDALDALPPAYAQVERLQAEVKALTRDAVDAKRALDDAERDRRGLESALAGAESSKRRVLAKKQRELDDALEDIARRRDVERELRTKVKDLETQCDGLERRLRASGGGYAPPRVPPAAPPAARLPRSALGRGARGLRSEDLSRARTRPPPRSARAGSGLPRGAGPRRPRATARPRAGATARRGRRGSTPPRTSRRSAPGKRRGSGTARAAWRAARARRTGAARRPRAPAHAGGARPPARVAARRARARPRRRRRGARRRAAGDRARVREGRAAARTAAETPLHRPGAFCGTCSGA